MGDGRRCAVLYCAVLYCAVLCRAVLCSTIVTKQKIQFFRHAWKGLRKEEKKRVKDATRSFVVSRYSCFEGKKRRKSFLGLGLRIFLVCLSTSPFRGGPFPSYCCAPNLYSTPVPGSFTKRNKKDSPYLYRWIPPSPFRFHGLMLECD